MAWGRPQGLKRGESMGKYLGLKAMLMVAVIFFHSFVLIPRSYAGAMGAVIDISVARQALRSIAPSVLKATPAGRGYAIGYFTVAGIAYLLVKSGAVTAMKNWFDTNIGDGALPLTPSQPEKISSNGLRKVTCALNGGVNTWFLWEKYYVGDSWHYYTAYAVPSNEASIRTWLYGSPTGGGSVPTTSQDYGVPLEISQPNFPGGSVVFTPGGADLLNGANPPGPVTEMTDGDLDKMAGALGATEPVAGTQPNPTAGDNALSPDANASIPLLRLIANYVSNLVGIKTDTGGIKTNTDNLVSGQAAQTNAVNSMSGKMDNIATAIQNQTIIDNQMLGKLDNVAQSMDTLKNTTASQSSLSSRVGEVKILLLTKFPFSIVGAVTSPGAVSGGTYSIPDLQFPMGTSVSVDPLANAEIHSWVTWLRGLMAVGMWAIFVLVMVRRVTEI